MRRVFSNDALQNKFAQVGYVSVPMLDAGQVTALLNDFATLRPADSFVPDGSGFAQNAYHCTFLDADHDYRRKTLEILTRHFTHVLEQQLAGYAILSANFYVKPPGRGDFPIHQNWPVLADHNDTSVTIWCPLVDVDVTNGCLHIVPASHKLMAHVEGPNSPAYFTPMMESIYTHLVPLPSPAGTGFIFDDGIVHGSPPNMGDAPRIAVQITCIPTDAKSVFFFKESEERFELIDAGPDFYLDYDVAQMFSRQPDWHSLGHIPSRNRLISEAEFVKLLADGDAIRKNGFGPTPIIPPSGVAAPHQQPLRQRLRRHIVRVIPARTKPMLRLLLGRGTAPAILSKPINSQIRDAHAPHAAHTTVQVRDYYEEMTPAYIAGFGDIFQGSRPESTEALIDYLVEATGIQDGMHVLDAGCGIGGPAVALASRRAATIEGLTLATAQVVEAQRRVADAGLVGRVTVSQGDFHQLASLYPAETFDRVLFLESICHAEDYRTVLAGAHTVLKPGGGLYIKDFYCVDNRSRPAMAAGQVGDLERLNTLYRLQMPDLASMVDLLSDLGFAIRFMRMPDYEPTYTHWASYEHAAGRAWAPTSGEPGDIIQAVEFFCWKR